MYLFKKLSFRGKSEVLEIKMRNWPKFSEKKKNLNTNFKIKWVKEDKINPRRTKIHIELWICLVTKNLYEVSYTFWESKWTIGLRFELWSRKM